ncbi:hypothetical protein QVM52_29365, partial [Pseudomonas mosselii]|uniref:hypothetical protein n=1 Tax=Pseudomonas mosselii TaxID=78327 RepID=UPI00352B507E
AGNPTEFQLPKGANWVSRDFVQNLAQSGRNPIIARSAAENLLYWQSLTDAPGSNAQAKPSC